ncbi:MAG: lipopolysaccharide heptosyltransferase II [Candidatus Omnitrophica bacterium]|nr:lipopolysaccharide heptosyltransferase II [Candidatus Omnitrophota bacterium]MDD5610197.1 lipopolysaccharide heptosyltransferase II [Candidatus Omnitrophota bacterium]
MKILLIHPYGIGDVLFMTPLIRAIKQQLNVEYIDAIIGSRTKQILENNPHIHELFIIDKDKWKKLGWLRTCLEKRRLYQKLEARHYDVLIDFSLRKEYARWLRGLRIPKRIGFNHEGRGKYLNFRLDIPQGGFQAKHAIEFYAELGKFLGVTVADKRLEFKLSTATLEKAGQLLEDYAIAPEEKILAVVPGSGSSWGKDAYLKQWPVQHFSGLITKIAQDIDFSAVVILGSDQENSIAEKLKQGIAKKAINLCGKTDLATSAAIVKKAVLLLANDGGMVHIASSLDTPLIAIYGPVDPIVYGPYPKSEKAIAIFKEGPACRPCYFNFSYESDCPQHACLQDFTPLEAYQQIQEKHFLKNLVK